MPKLLSNRQNWIITKPYVLSSEDLLILENNPPVQAKDWSRKKEYKELKDRIREYYFDIQEETCCYCRLQINRGTENIEIEHIIDKNRRLDFIFEPLNLVISCHKCNFTKSTKRVMYICPPEKQYSTDPTHFKILHGHFHKYFENIEFRAGSVYHSLTDVGEFTINKCGLDRFGLAEQREKVTMYEDDEIISDVIEIRESNNNSTKIDELIDKLKAMKKKS